ncbi:hypothetical protein P22_3764 [Propionispora sp. 2/2-37]|uniref:acyl-CoA thioesterase n=1 Tax=Propionispora sp. 2/2-37 TaxID=1677858 RepID=UPI0006BB5B59|nr:thioesterase family protein [Propionispora sp. 2/2-37]CUH97632.1 hypothetical protein P22_3764 [Propionispora sp. 2/2-37]
MVSVREKVRFVETDMMGVVHHSNYFRWFEMGRVEYLRQSGILLLDLMAEGIVFPITQVRCNYRASAKFDDYLLIETILHEASRAKMEFTYRVLREEDGLLLAEGWTQNVFTDGSGKIVRLPEKYAKRLLRAGQGQEV